MAAFGKLLVKGLSTVGSAVVKNAPKVFEKAVQLIGKGASKVAEKAPEAGVKISEGAGKIAEKLTGEAVETAGRETAEQVAKKTAQETAEQVAKEAGEKVAKETGEDLLNKGGKKVAQEATESIGQTVFKKIRNFGIGLGVAQAGLSATGNGDLIPNMFEAGKGVAGGMVDATSAITDLISTATKVINHVVKGDFGGAMNDISEFGQNHPVASAVALGAAGFMGRSTALGKIAMVGAAVLGGNHLLQANAEAAASSDSAALGAINSANNMSPIADTEATQPTTSANAELNDAVEAYTASQTEPSSSMVQDETPTATQQDDYSLGA